MAEGERNGTAKNGQADADAAALAALAAKMAASQRSEIRGQRSEQGLQAELACLTAGPAQGAGGGTPVQEEQPPPSGADPLANAALELSRFWGQVAIKARVEKPEEVRPLMLSFLRRGYSVAEVQEAVLADPGQWASEIKDKLPAQPGQPSPAAQKAQLEARRRQDRRADLENQIRIWQDRQADPGRPELRRRIEVKLRSASTEGSRAYYECRLADFDTEPLRMIASRQKQLAELDAGEARLAAVPKAPPSKVPDQPAQMDFLGAAAGLVPLASFAQPRQALKIMTADELLKAQFPTPRHAISQLIPEGLTLLAGKPKLGKSFLGLNFSMAICGGELALGIFRAAKGEVLYLALEETWPRLKKRLDQVREDRSVNGVHLAREWPRQDKGGLLEIISWVQKHPDTRLVVIDTWPRFRSERSRTRQAYEEDYEHAGQLKWLADHYALAVVAVVHCRKSKLDADDPMDELTGTTGLSGAADTIMVLRRQRGQPHGSLFVTGRDVEERELALTFDDSGLWTCDEQETAPPKVVSVRDALRQAGRPLSPGELAPLIGKTGDATRQLLRRMLAAGLIARAGGLYCLPEQ